MRRVLAAVAVLTGLLAAAPAPARAATIGGCRVFPPGNAWNRDISRAPVDPRSDEYVRNIGLDANLHPDFGSGRQGNFGIPLTVVPALLPMAQPVHRVVKVDVYLPGCPPSADLIYQSLVDLLDGRIPTSEGARFGR